MVGLRVERDVGIHRVRISRSRKKTDVSRAKSGESTDRGLESAWSAPGKAGSRVVFDRSPPRELRQSAV
jgi:hypothetical protein